MKYHAGGPCKAPFDRPSCAHRLALLALLLAACGSDSESATQEDLVFDIGFGDVGDEVSGGQLGDACNEDQDCLSNTCMTFGESRVCTESCVDVCPDNAFACFESFCTPIEFCDDSGDVPVGPGCPDSPCSQCDDDASCVDDGGFVCRCNAGFMGDGISCSDIDECTASELNDCDANANCVNASPGFACTCAEGFSGDGRSCSDDDECADGDDNCADDATCSNDPPGTFTCTCRAGFVGDGATCDDIDECADGELNDCDPNADCTNEPAGSFSCDCRDGYAGSGTTCSDIDECADGELNDCDPNADCTNDPPGSFTCDCRDGYDGTGTECTLITYGIEGDLDFVSPGIWGDGTMAESCQAYRFPSLPYLYEGSIGDGIYTIQPVEDGPTFDVFCDMTTDLGGWTVIDPFAARVLGGQFDEISSAACQLNGDSPRGSAAGELLCRYDVPVGFVFDTMRLDNVLITALAGADQQADLAWYDGDWAAITCGSSGDVVFGVPIDDGPSLSLGQTYGAPAGCGTDGSYGDGTSLNWDGWEVTGLEDTTLRLQFGESGGQVEGWEWTSGAVLLREHQTITGALTPESPGTWEDGSLAASCVDYRYPSGPFTYAGSTGDGVYRIQPDPGGPVLDVPCDMTTAGGGWMAVTPQSAATVYSSDLTALSGGSCSVVGVALQVFGTGRNECRYDIDVAAPFNHIRTRDVQIEALAATDLDADLTDTDSDWGTVVCSGRGDVRLGSTADARAALSLGVFNGVSDACDAGVSFTNTAVLGWIDDEAAVSEDTVLRVELGEADGDLEGWRWTTGAVLVRRSIGIQGSLTAEDPGRRADGTPAVSCRQYRRPTVGPYGYFGDVGDGIYTIDPDGPLWRAPMDVFCDMTTDGGGWTEITIPMAFGLDGDWVVTFEPSDQGAQSDFDGSNRPRSRDTTGAHTATYTFEVPFGFQEFYLDSYQMRANAGGTDTWVSEINPTSFIQSVWTVAHSTAHGDVSFGSAGDAGPTTSWAANLEAGISGRSTVFDWPGPAVPTGIYTVGEPSTQFRLGCGEGGSQTEGWFPWWSGTIRVR